MAAGDGASAHWSPLGLMWMGTNGKFSRAPAVESFEERTAELERRQITAVTGSAAMRATRQLNGVTNGFPALG